MRLFYSGSHTLQQHGHSGVFIASSRTTDPFVMVTDDLAGQLEFSHAGRAFDHRGSVIPWAGGHGNAFSRRAFGIVRRCGEHLQPVLDNTESGNKRRLALPRFIAHHSRHFNTAIPATRPGAGK